MRERLMRCSVVAAICLAHVRPLAAQDSAATVALASAPMVPALPSPAAEPSDSLYREGTRALTKGDYWRAADLFAQLREEYPRSPYAPDSYYWEAFALQRLDNTKAMQRALSALDAQRLRFPESAITEDVVALRTRIEGALSRELASARALAAASLAKCGAKEDSLALTSLMVLTALTDPEQIRGYLASLLTQRAPCSRDLRLGVVHMLGLRREAASRRMLTQVADHDFDDVVRAAARRVLALPPTANRDEARNTRPALRMADDTLAHQLGDSLLAPARITRWIGNQEQATVQLLKPGQLIVMSVVPGQPIELLEPSMPSAARTMFSGTVTLALRRMQIASGRADATDALANQMRSDAAREACMARKTAEVQAQIDRQWRNRADKSNKPVVQGPVGGTYDIATGGGAALNNAAITCGQQVSRISPAPSTAPATETVKGALRDGTDRYLVVLTTARPLTFSHLVVRLGTFVPTGTSTRNMMDAIAMWIFDGQTSGWAGSWIGW